MKNKAFVTGAICGVVICALVHALIFMRPPHFGPPPPHGMERMLLKRFERELGLDAAQVEKISPIVSRMHVKMLSIRVAQDAETTKIMSEMDKEMEQFLTPAQREKLAEMRSHFDRMHAADEEFLREKGLGLPPPPPLP